MVWCSSAPCDFSFDGVWLAQEEVVVAVLICGFTSRCAAVAAHSVHHTGTLHAPGTLRCLPLVAVVSSAACHLVVSGCL